MMSHDLPGLDMNQNPTLVSILGEPVLVSEHSRFDADAWYLDGVTPGQTRAQFAIHWDVVADQRLIDGLKYLAALLFLERDDRRVYKHTTASTFSAGARHLLRFMERHGYSSFAQFDADAVKHFRRNLHVALSDPEQAMEEMQEPENLAQGEEGWMATFTPDLFEEGAADEESDEAGEDDGPEEVTAADRAGKVATRRSAMTPGKIVSKKGPPRKEISEDEFTYSAAFNRLRILQNLWDHREELNAAGVPPLPVEPFKGTSARTVAEDAAAVAVQLIPPLPDEVAIAIMSDAFRLIEQPADDVIELQRLCLAEMARLTRQPPTPERIRIKAVMQAFRFSEVDGTPWRALIELGPEESGGSDRLRELIDLIRSACVTVIFSGTGCRISEVVSLETGGELKELPLFATRQPERALPACVSTRKSKSGLHEHFFMHAKLSKGEKDGPKDEEWLIGSRPMDRSDVEPPVLRAIRVLERLYEPWREIIVDDEKRSKLILTFRTRGLPRGDRGILSPSSGQLRHSLSDYVSRDEIGLAGLADQVKANPKLRPYVIDEGRNIRPHQWRKTFALYVMRVDERMIPALSHHFKHLSLAMTENSYMPQDPTMIAAGDSVHMMETARYLYERRRRAGSSFGNLEKVLEAHEADIEKLLGDLPFEDGYPEIRHALVTRDLRIFHAEHGRCLIAANPDKARCHSAGGTSSWRRLTPNHATRTPGMCVGCDNFAVSAEHAGFWERRYVENQTAWLGAHGSGDFRVTRERAKQAESILQALKVRVPTIESNGRGAGTPAGGTNPGAPANPGAASKQGGASGPAGIGKPGLAPGIGGPVAGRAADGNGGKEAGDAQGA